MLFIQNDIILNLRFYFYSLRLHMDTECSDSVFRGIQFVSELNIDNPYFEGMVNQIYPHELQMNKANTSDTEVPFLDLHLSISNGFVSSKIYDKRDDFDNVNFPFLDGDVSLRPSYGLYISQLIIFAGVCSHVEYFNARNKCLTAKLLKQGYRYHKLRKAFSMYYRRHHGLVSKFNAGLTSLLHQGLSEPEFYGDLVTNSKRLWVGLIFHISLEK